MEITIFVLGLLGVLYIIIELWKINKNSAKILKTERERSREESRLILILNEIKSGKLFLLLAIIFYMLWSLQNTID